MGLFKKTDLSEHGVRGTAVIRSEENLALGDDDSALSRADFGIGSIKFRFELEVTVDGQAPYTVNDTFKVPARAGGEAGPGVELPVLVDPDDAQRVEIDWDRFLAAGGADKLREANQRKREAKAKEMAESAGVDLSDPYGEPPANATPRELLDWQRSKGIIDDATYEAILANNPDMK